MSVDEPVHPFVFSLSLLDHQAKEFRMTGGEADVFTRDAARYYLFFTSRSPR